MDTRLTIRKRRVPPAPPLRGSDLVWLAWIESAWRQFERELEHVDWDNPVVAAHAAVLTAILRLDVDPRPEALAQWWALPLEVALGHSLEATGPRVDPVTRWALMAGRACGPVPMDQWDVEVLPNVARTLESLLPPGSGSVWERASHAVSRIRLICCPMVSNVGVELGEPLAPYSRWRLDYGPLPEQARVTLSRRLLAEGAPLVARMSCDEAGQLLKRLRTELRGDDIADLGTSARLDRSQGAEVLARFHNGHDWGGFEAIALTWCERRLRDPDSDISPQSISRYLSALEHVVQAQRELPFLYHDPQADGWFFDSDRWEAVVGELRRKVSDTTTASTLAMMCAQMREWVPLLGQMDLSLLDGMSPPPKPAAHVVTPTEFEAAVHGMFDAGGAAARAAVAMAVMFYTGARLMEAVGLLAEDVVVRGDGVLRIWSHDARRLKSRGRRIRLANCMPPSWRKRLMDLATANRQIGQPRSYLFADPRQPCVAPDARLVATAILRLRQVTGDPNVTAHSLRHSFATLTLLRMAVARLPELRAYPARILRESIFAPAALEDWQRGWFAGPVPDDAILELARVLGHSGPATSLESYSHVMDLVVRAHLALRLPAPRRSVMAAALRLGPGDFSRLEKRARRRHGDVLQCARFPTLWALQAELDRDRGGSLVRLPTLPLAPVLTLRLVELPHVLEVLERPGQDIAALANLFCCPESELRALGVLLQSGTPRPVFPMHRSRMLFSKLAIALEPVLDGAHIQAQLAVWSTGQAVTGQRRMFDDPGMLPVLAPLMQAVMAVPDLGMRWQVLLVRPHRVDADGEAALRRLQRRLHRRLKSLEAQDLMPRVCTWRDLRLEVRSPSPVKGAAGCHLILVPGTPSRGVALGSGQSVLAALDAAWMLLQARSDH